MSFEGYYQCWCPNGHYWEGVYDYSTGGLDDEDRICEDCGKEVLFCNRVDNTNFDNCGFIELNEIGTDINGEPVFELPTIYYRGCDKNTGEPIYTYKTNDYEKKTEVPLGYPNIKENIDE